MRFTSRILSRIAYLLLLAAAFTAHTCAVEAYSQIKLPRIPAHHA